ncbi:MAG: arsenite methyltransferase [Dehalococcoidia bacterium]|nr:arsenite methyltransferase [Dehalococcoidia bacterium]
MTDAKDQAIQEIKEVVKKRYAKRALDVMARPSAGKPDSSVEACCGTTYQAVDLVAIPGEAILASAGCGNPTALADLHPGEVVLDLGSGGGIDCFLASRAVGPKGRVLGIDMTPEMVELARSNARRIKATNVEFYLGHIEELPFDSNTMDVVISNCVVCLSPDKDAVFGEAFRVLRAGGRLHLSDMMLVGDLPDAVKRDPQKWAECVSGADQRETYVERLRAAGFQDVTIAQEQPYRQEPGLENLRSVHVIARKLD